ncbi:murein biosynthesis integral membrane protein MurJ [Candidatus Nardonella dryophthoridicola]|uniref:Probable lipid II flippase MurJ n=1 Tax=endosymbiont of Rhynchophorus ferrugineus TaxID=1972133 RepID=A0A2Z5T7F4_9GAMM|nr:murein biosynthesis integral membrane protein MurJ [Candidatus Nardonella dryophthoridicola]BBA85005.1 putative lipid II flippase MurJ [endosymbiont of Rhynchophorus ferrugineus]
MDLLKKLMFISSVTVIVKIFGFVKDIILANCFGANNLTDCFFNSFKIINLFRKVLAEGIFYQLLIPTLIEHKKNNSINNTNIFIKKIVGFLILLTLFIIITCFILSKHIVSFMNPGYRSIYKINKTIELFIILLPYIFISSFVSLTTSIFNVYNSFIISSLTPIIINILSILFVLTEFFNKSIIILPLSLLIGGIIQLIIHIIYIKKKININLYPIIDLKDNNIVKFYKSTKSVIFHSFINQSSIILNTILSSFLGSGSVSWIYYSDKIMEFNSGILGVSLSTMILPILSKNYNNIKEYSNVLDWGIKLGIIFSVPLLILVLILSKHIIMSLFYYGNFSYFDVEMTKNSLISYSIGLISIVLSKILISAFNARKDSITPLKLSIVTIAISQLINLLLISFKHIGLSLSISINSILYFLFLIIYLVKKKIYITNYNWLDLAKKILISSFCMIVILLFLIKYIYIYYYDNCFIRIFKLLFLIISGLSTYLISLYLNDIKPNDFIFYQ